MSDSAQNMSASQNSYVDSYQPPQSTDQNAPVQGGNQVPASSPVSPSEDQSMNNSGGKTQSLEELNIFFLLGVEDGTAEQKEGFLDELQQVIWEDFLADDVELLITREENETLAQILTSQDEDQVKKQEQIIEYLEKLIPDLEEIMMEKALELKEDMVRERILGMKEFFANDQSALSTIEQAEQASNKGMWRDGAQLLNSLKS